MPNGKTHDRLVQYSTWSYTGLLFFGLLFSNQLWTNLYCVGTAFLGGQLGRIVSPDLDQKIFFGNYLLRKRIGPILEKLWQWYWTPYSLIPHRHWLSHSLVLSSLLRLFYLAIPILCLDYFFHWHIAWGQVITSPYFLTFTGGLICADASHILADVLSQFD